MRRALLAALVAALGLVAGVVLTASSASVGPIPGFSLLRTGPGGGTDWQGVIPDTVRPRAGNGESIVYLPPGYSPAQRYPVVYILHGLPGSPYSVVDGMRFASIADRLVAAGVLRPFVAVIPSGPRPHYDGEWGGVWERYLIDDVLPWSQTYLPVDRGAAGRTLAGYSAGGFGAIDIGLRHPAMFGTLEAWSGYFEPPHDGPFRRASAAALLANDPTSIVGRDAAQLRARERFFLSVGSTHDRWTEARTLAFADELRMLRLPFRLWLAPGGHDGRFWRRQLPAALEFAEPRVPGALQ
ncbi:MAG TPA: alpha/beta hydrolase-fold protein [Gaiellaceae bacterium]